MSARRIQRLTDGTGVPPRLRDGVVAIGNFDGVHRGHQAVLKQARRLANGLGRPLICLTFEPHPRTVFRADKPVPRLTPAPMKARLLEALDYDAVVEQPFDRDYASHSAERFVTETLVEALGAKHVVVGFDFRFGARREGDVAFLAEAGARHGFSVAVVDALGDAAGQPVSSSRVREHLGRGEVEDAGTLLGYRWTIEGEITHGQKLGRQLGYPTANLKLADDLLAHGIYAVRLRRADGTLIPGVASYGRRPTFDDGAPLFETFLFDFSDDLYGETVDVSLFSFLRGEARFENAAALVRQMDVDAAVSRALLDEVAPLSELDRRIAF